MNNISEKFNCWIFDSFAVSPQGLGLYRIFTALFILCFLMPSLQMYEFLGTIPDYFYAPPPGPMWLFDGFPSEEFFLLSHGILIISLLLLLIGYKTFWASISTGLVLLVIKGFFYSLGKINHDLLLSAVPLVMAFSGWGAAYSADSYRQKGKVYANKVESWPLTLLALFIGFMMFTAGFPKLLGGWLYLDTQATMGHLFNQYYGKERQDLLATLFLHIDSAVFWEILDYATIIFELGFLAAIFHPRTTKLFISFAVLFHFSIMVMMNISFLHNFPAYAAFLNWTLINKKFKKGLTLRFASPIVLVVIFALTGAVILLGYSFGLPELSSDLEIEEVYIVSLSVLIAVGYIIQQIKNSVLAIDCYKLITTD